MDLQKICEQIEYWFGDSNLPYDKFLKKYLNENGGWVPLEILLKFNRLKSLKVDSVDQIKSAIKKSNGFITLNESETAVKRVKDMPTKEEMLKRLERTLYFTILPNVEGLDDETIKKEFSKFGKILSFSLYKRKAFAKKPKKEKNDGIVEFSNIKEAQDAKISLTNFASFPEKKFSLKSIADVERMKKEQIKLDLLKNFDIRKIFVIDNLSDETTFHQLTSTLQKAIDGLNKIKNNKDGESDGTDKEKDKPAPSLNSNKKLKTKEGEITLTDETKKELIRNALKEIKHRPQRTFHCDFFPSNNKESNENGNKAKIKTAIVRISANSDLTSDRVKRALEASEKHISITVYKDEEKAKVKWIESMEEFKRKLGEKKKKGNKRRKRR